MSDDPGGGGVFLADAPVMPAPAPGAGEPCGPEIKSEIRFVVFILDESEYPKTDDPDKLREFAPSKPAAKEGEKVDYQGPKVVGKGKEDGISYLEMLFIITITKERTCPDGTKVEDKLTLFIFVLIVWLPAQRGKWAEEMLALLKELYDASSLKELSGEGAKDATMRWQDNALVYVGHNTGSNDVPWEALALTGMFSGELSPGQWDTRMVDMSCFGEDQGRVGQEFAFHSEKEKFVPPDKETLGYFGLGDVNGGQKHWNKNRPKEMVVRGREGKVPSSRLNPPKRTTPPSPRPR